MAARDSRRSTGASRISRLHYGAACLLLVLLNGCASSGSRPSGAAGAAASPISVAWIYGPECAALTAVPEHFWRADGDLILFEAPAPGTNATLVVFDPEQQTRRPLVDAVAAMASLRRLVGEAAPVALPWPDSIEPGGARGLYVLAGDVFVLEFATSAFRRVTETAAPEHAAQFAPNGRRVAYVRDHDLWVFDLPNGAERRVTHDGSDTTLNGTLSWVYWEEILGRRDIGYWWAPDSNAIAYLQTDESAVTVVHFQDFTPAVPRLIEQRYPKAGTANPTVRVGVVELAADSAATTTWISGTAGEYVARVQWLPDAERLAVQTLSRDQRRLDLWFADRRNGAARNVLTETDPVWVNIHDDLWFLGRGGQFLWASERDGYGHLYRYDDQGALLDRVTSGEWSIRSAGGGVFWLRQAVVAVDEAAGWVYFTALRESSVEKHLYRVRLDGSQLTRLSQPAGTHRVSFSPDARHYIDEFSDISTPPALGLHTAGGGLQCRLTDAPRQAVAELEVQFPELTTIPAADGFRMPAQILRPKGFDPTRRYPLILHTYAGPSAPKVSNSWQRDNWFDQVLLGEGFVVVKVDNRSATAISKKLENTVDRQLCGDSECNDLLDAVRWLKGQSWVDPERVGVWGWSGGGSTTLLLMTRSREFRAGIAVAPVTDWHYYDTKWAESAMKTPADNPDGYRHTSLVQRAGDLHGRLLLVHGTYDDNVHPQNAWHFIDELVAAGKPFDMMMYPMRKHGIADRAARVHLFEKMVEFWALRL
ncbi:MAG: S9 family peptidase [Planctomycetota bacterium]